MAQIDSVKVTPVGQQGQGCWAARVASGYIQDSRVPPECILGARMDRIDARVHLSALGGQTIWTATRRLPNRILRMTPDVVVVATDKSPQGKPVPLDDVQAAFDRLAEGQEVRISVPSLGYRSAFVGAAMLSLPGSRLLAGPTRVRLEQQRDPQ
jgi:hypothetical protein